MFVCSVIFATYGTQLADIRDTRELHLFISFFLSDIRLCLFYDLIFCFASVFDISTAIFKKTFFFCLLLSH